MKKSDTSERLLRIIEILQKNTDEDQPLTMPDLLFELEQFGIVSDRRSVYKQISLLKKCGYPIYYKNNHGYYYKHPFSLAETFILMDSIENSKALSPSLTSSLQEKIISNLPVHQNTAIKTTHTNSRKVNHPQLLEIMNLLLRAIQNSYPVSFQYFDLQIDQTKKYRKNKKVYTFVPYAIVSDDGWYYCIFYSETYESFLNFRIDKMERVTIEETPSETVPFHLEDYLRSSFHMYQGEAQTITIRFQLDMANYVFDQFGRQLIISKVTDKDFIANIRTAITPNLVSWLIQFQESLEILKPQELIDEMIRVSLEIRRKYEHE